MAETSNDLKAELDKTKQSLKLVRDEILLRLHLASMDARDAWKQLNHEVQQATHEVTATSLQALRDLNQKLRDFAASIESGRKNDHA
jgi:hypothetical protein